MLKGNIGFEVGALINRATPGDPVRVEIGSIAEDIKATDGKLTFEGDGTALNVISAPLVNGSLTFTGALKVRFYPGTPIRTQARAAPIDPLVVNYSMTVNSSGQVTASSVQLPSAHY